MSKLDDVYGKFGFTAEAAQLLETEIGNVLIKHGIVEEDLVNQSNPKRAADFVRQVDKHTLDQLIAKLNGKNQSIANLEDVLARALDERNRLSHSFYRQHNFRRNSDEGRQRMLDDLESIHQTLLDAYKAVMLLSGVDLDKLSATSLSTKHFPIY
jgi:anaerobic ribonucleoside-triphosphate reductase